MKRLLPICLAGTLAACQTPKPEIDPEAGLPVSGEPVAGAPAVGTPVGEVAEEAPAKKKGFFGLFGSKKDKDGGSSSEVDDVVLSEADVPDLPPEPAPRRKVDKSASLEEQFRQAASGSNGIGRDDWRFSSTELKRVCWFFG